METVLEKWGTVPQTNKDPVIRMGPLRKMEVLIKKLGGHIKSEDNSKKVGNTSKKDSDRSRNTSD